MHKHFFSLSIVLLVVLFSVSVQAVSLSSNGEVHTISQNNLKFVTGGDGLVDVYRQDLHLAKFGFTLKGTVNAQQRFLNSWDTTWTWQVLSNNDSNITVLGSANWQGLEWEQYWYFSDSEQKFANFLTNNTGFDVLDTSFYYVVQTDSANVECLNYVDYQRSGNKYCFEQDFQTTQNLEGYLKQLTFSKAVFNFDDLINTGFSFNYLFAGQLNNAHSSLSGNGFIVGVTKNAGVFPSGVKVILDPSIIDTSNKTVFNYDNVLARDSLGNIWHVYSKAVTGDIDIWVSKSTDDGDNWTTFNLTSTSDFNEVVPHIDINSTDGLTIVYDSYIEAVGETTTQVKLATCSSGGCDAAAEFLTDVNISQCSPTGDCSNSNFLIDQNNTSHITFVQGSTVTSYRSNTGYTGLAANWSADTNVITGLGTIVYNATGGFPDSTGVLVSKNGSGKKLAFTTTNASELYISYFDGTDWQSSFLLAAPGQSAPMGTYAGYDGNFYVAYARFDGGVYTSLNFAQCDMDANCAQPANWVVDVNMANGLKSSNLSMVQASDLNVYILAGSRPSSSDSNIHIFTRLPNGVWTTSTIGDGNLLQNDSNRTFNALVRNKDYYGSTVASPALSANNDLDYVYLTSNVSGGDPSAFVFDSNILNNRIVASFTVTPPSPFAKDPENGITNVNVDFNSSTEFVGPIVDINYLWQVDSEEISTDQNTVWDFNGADTDFNVSLIVNGNDGTTHFNSQSDQNVLLRTAAQSVDINFAFTATASLADVNFGATADGSTDGINYVVWGFPNDNNLLGLQVAQQYRVGDTREVCAVVNSAGDVNKLHCETFFNTHVLAKIPINISTLLAVDQPFSMSVNIVPAQSYDDVSVDQNFWFLYQTTPDSNAYNLTVDANVSFFIQTFLIELDAIDLNQTIQPYVVPATDGINVIFTSKDSLTFAIVPNSLLVFSRNISGTGNVEVASGISDDVGRIAFAFITNVDHNFSVYFPQGTLLKTGGYIPQSVDSTNGIEVTLPDITGTVDTNAVGVVDVNFLQNQVTPRNDGSVDLNQIVSSTRTITSVEISVDHNGSNQFSDTNSETITAGAYSQTIDANGLSRIFPLVITFTFTFSDGNTSIVSKGVRIIDRSGIYESLVSAKDDLGDVAGTSILLVFIIAILLGFVHYTYPAIDNSHTFVLASLILLAASFVGWVDGISWLLASIAAGGAYFLRRVQQ